MATPAESTEQTSSLARRVGDITRVLDAHYGPREWASHGRPVDVLIETVLSQNTSDVNSHRAFRALQERFGPLEAVSTASVEDIEEAIRLAGLSRIKSVRIRQILEQLVGENGSLDLSFLDGMEMDAARRYLVSLPGVGPKTASCVLVFALGAPALPVDTHVHRVARRLGLIAPNVSAETAQSELEDIVEPRARYSFHLHIIEHGRRVCHARKPSCERCVLARFCPSAFTF